MPRNQTEDATINDVVAHIVLTKRGAFARCGRCGSPLVKITNTSQIVLIGYTFDGRIWCETADRRARRERDRKAVAIGRASAADRQRVRHNDYGRCENDWSHEYRSGLLFGDDPRIPEGFEERFRLPQFVACGPCGAVNHIPALEPGERWPEWAKRWICRHNREVAEDAGITC